MFGKGKSKMSSNDRFVMSMGRKAGNVKGGGKGGDTFGEHKGPPGKSGKAGPDPFGAKGMSPGQVNTFKTKGK